MKVFLVLGVPGASMLAMMLVKIDMLTIPELEVSAKRSVGKAKVVIVVIVPWKPGISDDVGGDCKRQ